jgi:type II secretion system protein G
MTMNELDELARLASRERLTARDIAPVARAPRPRSPLRTAMLIALGVSPIFVACLLAAFYLSEQLLKHQAHAAVQEAADRRRVEHEAGGLVASKAAARDDIAAFSQAIEAFHIDNNRYPTSDEGLDALIHRPTGLKSWRGPYIAGSRVPKDPWGHPYLYRFPAANFRGGFDLISMGLDGVEGGGDDIRN